MSDITSAKTAVQVGKIYNLDGILVGSMMKVGEEITMPYSERSRGGMTLSPVIPCLSSSKSKTLYD